MIPRPSQIADEHARADARCGRAWVCACGACRTTRRTMPTIARALDAKNRAMRDGTYPPPRKAHGLVS